MGNSDIAGFFKAQLRATLGRTPVRFRLSRRMTTSAGQTARSRPTNRRGRRWYEISVSTTLLFQCFAGDDHRPITVTGLLCHDRLEALQRVMEHELIHLTERLLWTTSSCAARRFQSMAWRLFRHTTHTHALITPRERALAKFGVYPGFPTLFWGLSVFFVGDLMGKALWKLVENAARFPRRGGRVLYVHGAVSFHRARPCGPRWLPGRGAMRHVELDRRVLGLQSTGE